MIYGVPLEDGSYGFAQAVDAMMTNVIYVALFAHRVSAEPDNAPDLVGRDAISLSATWRQHLNGGTWKALDVRQISCPKSAFPNERFAATGYVGAKHHDAGMLAEFLAAYHGLMPWNVMVDENYFDKLLAPGVIRPSTAVVLDPERRVAYRRAKFGVSS
jgi:hypothetical protein